MQNRRRRERFQFDWGSPLALLLHFAAALAASVLALVLWRMALKPIEPDPFPLLLAAVVVSSMFGGFGPGLLACILTAALGLAYYVNHSHGFEIHSLRASLETYLYLILAVALNWLIAVRRRSEISLRQQLKVSANITRNLGEGVYAVDRKGQITFMNPAAERLLGWTEEDLKGKDMHEVVHRHGAEGAPGEERGDGTHCNLPEILRSGATVRKDDDTFQRKDGEALPVAYSSAPVLSNGKITGAVLTFRDITDRKRAVEAMRASEERYRILVETSHESILLTDLYGFVLMANQRAANLYGYMTPHDMLGMNSVELIAPEDRVRLVQDRRQVVEQRQVVHGEYLSMRRDDSAFPIELSASSVLDDEGQPMAVINVVRDITERRMAEGELRASESRLTMQYTVASILTESVSLGEAMPKVLATLCRASGWNVGMLWTVEPGDDVLRCRYISHETTVRVPGFRQLSLQLTFSPGVDLPGTVWERGDAVEIHDVANDESFSRAPAASKEGLHGALAFPIFIGDTVYGVAELFSFQARRAGPSLTETMSAIALQIAQFVERKRAEEQLAYQVMHENLTELPNRALLQDRLDLALASARRYSRPLALVVLDLDRFKEINEVYGHRHGDHVLRQIAPRLRGLLRESDTVARLGGDEFALVLPGTDVNGAITAATKVLASLAQPFVVEGQTFDIGASIGLAIYPEHGADAEELLRRADIAMYVAKRSGSGYAIYAAEQDQYSPGRLALKSQMREAIENDQFFLEYQPKAELRTGKIDCVEALVRWQHPEHGLIPPGRFISLAEQAGLVQALNIHVLSAALRQCAEWETGGLSLRVAVNLSTASLQDQQVVGMIAGMLRATGVPANRLEIDVPEGAIIADPARIEEVLTRLHELGIQIAVDDFGMGHSSLAQLKKLRVDQIKIDRSRIGNIANNDDDAYIARSLIDLGHKLGLSVVAKGVEDSETAAILTTLGCDYAQGSYLSRAIPGDDVSRRFQGPEPQVSLVS